MKTSLIAAFFCLFATLAAEAQSPSTVALCGQTVTPTLQPGEGLASKYVGIWGEGSWSAQLCTALVVHSVDESAGKADVSYITANKVSRIQNAAVSSASLRIESNAYQLSIVFVLSGDGKSLQGTYTRPGEYYQTTLPKVS